MREYFEALVGRLEASLAGDECVTASFAGERSDFVRFNRCRVRQAGHVEQHSLSVDLVAGRRHAAGSLTLAGTLDEDAPRLLRLVTRLRETRAVTPEDPHLLLATEPHSSERIDENALAEPGPQIERIQQACRGADLVGIYAAGSLWRGFASSFGQRNWFATHNHNFDWSFYEAADKAVKASYAGVQWDAVEFDAKVQRARAELELLGRPARTISPGTYRVLLSPPAVRELLELLSWGGFGLRAHRTKQTPLLRMIADGATLHPAITLHENTAAGVAPNFQEAGFLRPDRVTLIERGQYRECLVSPRSAKEYGVATNGASDLETPESLELGAGTLPAARALAELDRGIYVGHLWYLNYSDRSACRATGMTRFATYWVEHGQIVAPLNVMRFDQPLLEALGPNLIALTGEQSFLLDSDTYSGRSTRSCRTPAALLDAFRFTL